MPAFYDGYNIFGAAVTVRMKPAANDQQMNAFFGVTGTQSLFGGGRGRTFDIRGVLWGDNLPDLVAARSVLLSYADGLGRVFTDTMGTDWPMVVFNGVYSEEGAPVPTPYGFWLPYTATFEGRI